MMRRGRILLCSLVASVFAETPGEFVTPAGVSFSRTEIRRLLQHSPLPPVPSDPTNRVADDPRAAKFGEKLFFDKRLSLDGTVSCATCHDPALGFADGRALPKGLGDGHRHTMSLWNVAHNRWYFWDGRADTLWSQALQPMERDIEMGLPREKIARVVIDDADYAKAYTEIFGIFDNATRKELKADEAANVFVNVSKAIAAYERTLISDDAPFDAFVAGLRAATSKNPDDEKKNVRHGGTDATGVGDRLSAGQSAEKARPAWGHGRYEGQSNLEALSASAQRGAKLFVGRADCRACHSGPNFTDGEFHTVRVPPRGNEAVSDAGRYEGIHLLMKDDFRASGAHSDERTGAASKKLERLRQSAELWGLFKTPSLRNVALTAPYMHQGQFATLPEVLHHYSTFENALPPGHHEQEITLQPLELTEQETADLLAFLKSLTGKKAGEMATKVRPTD